MTKILGLSAKKEGGKSTVAKFLTRNAGELFGDDVAVEVFPFARELKNTLANLFGIPMGDLTDNKDSLTDVWWESLPHHLLLPEPRPIGAMTARQVMQVFGTDIVRAMCPNAWVNFNMKAIYCSGPDIAICDDVRMPNEAIEIQKRGGTVIRLLRGRDGDSHASETALDDDPSKFNRIIDNRSMTISETNFQVALYLKEIGWAQQLLNLTY